MAISDRIMVKDLARREFKQRISTPVPTPDGGWIISFRDQPGTVVLDRRLNDVRQFDTPPQSVVAAGGSVFAVLTKQQLLILDPHGASLRTIPQRAWQPWAGTNCAFDGHDRLWYARPGDRPGTNDCLVIVDPASGITVAEQVIENDVGLFDLNPCPDPDCMLVAVSCGQDGTFLYHARWTGKEIAIQAYPFEDRSFTGGFSPNGREFVTGSHEGDGVLVHSLPGGEVVASIDSEDMFGDDDLPSEESDDVGYQALFLGDEHLLVDTMSRRLVLIERHKMELLGCVWPEGYELKAYDDAGEEADDPTEACSYEGSLDSFHCGAAGELLAGFERDLLNTGLLRLLDVSSITSAR
jgi:hypothetical protein